MKFDFCKYCDANIFKLDNNLCSCCGHRCEKLETNNWVDKTLKAGVKQHQQFLQNWFMFPVGISKDYPLEIRYRDCVYEIPLRHLANFLETPDSHILCKNCNEFFGTQNNCMNCGNTEFYNTSGHTEKLARIRKHLKIKGYRFWYSEEEETDLTCRKCFKRMRYNKDDVLFCPKCDK